MPARLRLGYTAELSVREHAIDGFDLREGWGDRVQPHR
jgi:hypothetical protein